MLTNSWFIQSTLIQISFLIPFFFLIPSSFINSNKNSYFVIGMADYTTKTLATFRGQACQGKLLKLKCPVNTTIIVTSAEYGNRWLMKFQQRGFSAENLNSNFDTICPLNTVSDKKASSNKSFDDESAMKQMKIGKTCVAPQSMQIVVDKCQDKQSCTVESKDNVFKNGHCISSAGGVPKLLQITYKCQPSEFSNTFACEGDTLSIRCPEEKNQLLVIFLATYGFHDLGHSRCSKNADANFEQSSSNFKCMSPNSTVIIRNHCYGHKKCSVHVKDDLLGGNLCKIRKEKEVLYQSNLRSVKKSLHAVYSCAPRIILLDEYVHLQVHEHDNTVYGAPKIISTSVKITEASPFPTLKRFSNVSQNMNPRMMLGNKFAAAQSPSFTGQMSNSPNINLMLDSYMTPKGNKDKFLLYFIVGTCGGLICLLLYLIIRVSKAKMGRKLNEGSKNERFTPNNNNICCSTEHSSHGNVNNPDESLRKLETSNSDLSSSGNNGSGSSTIKRNYGLSSSFKKRNNVRTQSEGNKNTGEVDKPKATINRPNLKLLSTISSNLRYNPNITDPCDIGYNKFDHNYDSFDRFKPIFHNSQQRYTSTTAQQSLATSFSAPLNNKNSDDYTFMNSSGEYHQTTSTRQQQYPPTNYYIQHGQQDFTRGNSHPRFLPATCVPPLLRSDMISSSGFKGSNHLVGEDAFIQNSHSFRNELGTPRGYQTKLIEQPSFLNNNYEPYNKQHHLSGGPPQAYLINSSPSQQHLRQILHPQNFEAFTTTSFSEF